MRPKYLLALALVVLTACFDAPTGPTGTQTWVPNPPTQPLESLYGVVEKSTEFPHRYALRQYDRLVQLVGHDDEFASLIRVSVAVTGRFNDDGGFVVTRLDYVSGKGPKT